MLYWKDILKIGLPFLTIIDNVRTYVRMYNVYIQNAKESLVLNLEIGKTIGT